jgi:hypothetical protein
VAVAVGALMLALTSVPSLGWAQSEYHWSDQFGNRSTLLNGTVIGGVSDLGAVFYNPGRLAQLDRPGFLLTAEAVELNHVELEGAEGDNLELEQTNFRGVPSLVAGLFTLPFLPGHKFAYSFLTRRRSESDLLLTTELQGDYFPSLPGEESYLGQWESVSKLDENWVGLSWAYSISPRVSVGVSTFGTYAGRKRRIEVDARAVPGEGPPAVLVRSREYRFSSYGLLWKAGLAANLAPFQIGLSLTTPQITPLGGGSIRFEELRVAPEISGVTPAANAVTVFREDKIPVSNRTPFAFGGGISWLGSRAVVHLSGEWYSGVSRYEIMAADSIDSQSSGSVTEFHVVDELDSVFNFGAGIEWQVSETFSAYGSAVRDQSAAPSDPSLPFEFSERISNSTSQADGFHLGAGVSLEASWIDLTAGFTYGGTEERLFNPLSNSNPTQTPVLFDPQLKLVKRRWRFLMGFSIPMVDGVSEKS